MKKKICKLSGVLIPVILTLFGMVGGWLYYRYVGCATGACAITSNPWSTTGLGGAFGLLLGLVLRPSGEKCQTTESAE